MTMIESSVVDKEEQHEHQDDGSHSSCSVERKESQEDHRAQEHGDDEDENLLENALALMSEQHGVDERTIDEMGKRLKDLGQDLDVTCFYQLTRKNHRMATETDKRLFRIEKRRVEQDTTERQLGDFLSNAKSFYLRFMVKNH